MGAWRWAIAAWSRPGVESICLDLQNGYGQCPPLLLWRLWALETKRAVSAEALAAAVTATRSWIATVVDPLRMARRALAQPLAGVDEDGRLRLRDQIRSVELAAERLLIEALEGLAATAVNTWDAPAEALLAVTAAWGETAPIESLLALAKAVEIGPD